MRKNLYTRLVNVRVTDDDFGKLKSLADVKNQNISEYVRQLLWDHLAEVK